MSDLEKFKKITDPDELVRKLTLAVSIPSGILKGWGILFAVMALATY